MASLSPAEIYAVARQAGFPPAEAAAMVGIALRESGGNPTAHNDNPNTGDDSVGLWQINMLSGSNGNYTREQLWNPLNNAKQAYNLWSGRGFQPWRPYGRFEWYQVVSGNPPAVRGNINFDAGIQAASAAGDTVTQADISGLTNSAYSSGGGGTTGAPSAATDEEYRKVLEDRFGAFSWLTDHPEVGPLLRRAMTEGMSWAAFQSALQETNWWRSRSEATRKWDAIYSTDPAEAARQVNDRRGDLARLASTLGVSLSRERVQMIAFQSLRFGWGEDDLQRAVLAEAKYKRRQEGDLGAMATQVKSIAAQYGVGAPDKRAFKFAKQILGGQMTIDGIRQQYANQAKALFPAFRDQLDNGSTIADIAAPYIDQASRLLEVSPEQIDLTDPKYQRALTHRGRDGKAQPMSLGEWSELLMSDERYGWEKTNNARDAAYGMVKQLATRFGGYA